MPGDFPLTCIQLADRLRAIEREVKIVMSRPGLLVFAAAIIYCFTPPPSLVSKEPQQTPKNTLTLRIPEPTETLSFQKPLKFHIPPVTDRTGNIPPNLVLRRDDGIFLTPEPREIVFQRVQSSLRTAGLLAANPASADYNLTVQIIQFGHVPGIGREYFFKVELLALLENTLTRESRTFNALGTSVAWGKKNIQVNMENALIKALRSFLHGAQFRDAVGELEQSAEARRASEAAAAAANAEAARKAVAESAPQRDPARPEERPAEPQPPPPEEQGTVEVSSNLERAEVYVGDGFVGNTPARIKLAPGRYTFRVVMPGENDWIRELSVLPGSELKIFARHTPKDSPPKPSAPAPDPKALSKNDILELLANFVPSARIATLVEQNGIKFKPTAADLVEIDDAGGEEDLLDAIRKAAVPANP